MSYDLDFWRYKLGVVLDHQYVYERLSNSEYVEGLESLPIESMLARVKEVFSEGWTKIDDLTWESKLGTGSFQLFSTDQLLRVDCYGVAGEDMNRFIDIAHEFGCALYDPQVMIRYED